MKKIKITINNKEIETTEGKTILQVVKENKLDNIPTLCHDDRIEPYGSCFLCVVEVKGLNKLVASCATPVADGMVITTDSERIRASRKTALELLLSNHYADCVGPCMNNCPANVDAQGYIALISQGKYKEALQLIKKTNPLPLSIGRVCVRDCELECRRKHIDEPVAINYLKRFVADIDNTEWKPQIIEQKDKHVAIIGGGPSGLTCAYYLRLKGYQVKIFEKLPKLGGMLRYGIPEYRLPKAILDKEINWILNTGVEVQTGVELGKDFSIQDLFDDGFQSVYIAVGAHKASRMGLNDEYTTEGVYGGIDFLRDLTEKGAPSLKGTVVIVGGGNTAIDAARTALRCGADKVKLVYRRTIKEMPAHHEEIEAAQKEGVEMIFLTNPKAIISENGKLKGIECIRMELKDSKDGSRPRPVPVEGSEFVIKCDYLIGAIGQAVDTNFAKKDKDIALSDWGTIDVKEESLVTNIPGVFAGGDAVTGPFTAVSSIGQGRKAAESIINYLENKNVAEKEKKFYSFKHVFNKIPQQEYQHIPKAPRNHMDELPVEERIHNFKEVELGLDAERAINETFRCLECGCSEYFDCTLRKYCDEYNIDISSFLGEVNKYKVDSRHPFISLDPNKCIDCGKCVRTCSEILKVSALGFVYRGFKAIVKPAMEKPLQHTNCISCGNCIDVCPTGAITEKYPYKVFGTLEKENHETICNFCSIGCKVNLKVVNDDIFYAANNTESSINSLNNGYLCSRGRFGHRYLLSHNRIQYPVINDNGKEIKTDLNSAIKSASDKLKSIIDKYGHDSVAVFGSPKLSNEELYLLQKLGRDVIKTNNVHSVFNLLNDCDQSELNDVIGITTSTASLDDITTADYIVAVNPGISEENLILEMKIKEAQKKGAKLILINSSEIKLTKYADLWLDTRKGTNTVLLSGLIHEAIEKNQYDKNFVDNQTEDFIKLKGMVSIYDKQQVTAITGIDENKYETFLEMMSDSNKNVVFIYNVDSKKEKTDFDLKSIVNYLLLNNRVQRKSNGIYLVREHMNSAGIIDMGMHPDYLPGHVLNKDSENLLEKLQTNHIKAALVFGEDPINNDNLRSYFSKLELLIVGESYETETTKQADIVLPLKTPIEQTGHYTSAENRIQKTEPVIDKLLQVDNWKIISEIANNIGGNFDYKTIDDIFAEIQKVIPCYSLQSGMDCWSKDLFINGFKTKNGKAKFATGEILRKTYNASKPVVTFSDSFYESKIKAKIII